MFIEWLREGLRAPGKSQRGLADALGVAPSAVSRLLNRERELLASEIEPAAAYLGVPPPVVGRRTIEPVKTIPVRYVAARGVWREGGAMNAHNPATIPVVSDHRFPGEQFAVRLDTSNRYMICVSYADARPQPVADDLVLVERTRSDLVEHVLCHVIPNADGSFSLRADGPPYVDFEFSAQNLRILGLCIGSFQIF